MTDPTKHRLAAHVTSPLDVHCEKASMRCSDLNSSWQLSRRDTTISEGALKHGATVTCTGLASCLRNTRRSLSHSTLMHRLANTITSPKFPIYIQSKTVCIVANHLTTAALVAYRYRASSIGSSALICVSRFRSHFFKHDRDRVSSATISSWISLANDSLVSSSSILWTSRVSERFQICSTIPVSSLVPNPPACSLHICDASQFS